MKNVLCLTAPKTIHRYTVPTIHRPAIALVFRGCTYFHSTEVCLDVNFFFCKFFFKQRKWCGNANTIVCAFKRLLESAWRWPQSVTVSHNRTLPWIRGWLCKLLAASGTPSSPPQFSSCRPVRATESLQLDRVSAFVSRDGRGRTAIVHP